MNLQISKNITGELTIKALINDIFICIQTASAGARKTSFIFELLFGVKMIKGLFKEKFTVLWIGEVRIVKIFSE